MHSDREKPVERPGKQLWHNIADAARALLNRPAELRGPFKTDEATLRKIAALPPSTSAAPEPVKDEPVAWTLIFADNYGVNTETTFKRQGLAEEYASRCSAPKPSVVPLYTRPAGERPAVAVEALREALKKIARSLDNRIAAYRCSCTHPCDDYFVFPGPCGARNAESLRNIKIIADAALTAEPQAVPEGMVLVPEYEVRRE